MSQTDLDNINNYVTTFLKKQGAANITKDWKSDSIQTTLKTLIRTSKTKKKASVKPKKPRRKTAFRLYFEDKKEDDKTVRMNIISKEWKELAEKGGDVYNDYVKREAEHIDEYNTELLQFCNKYGVDYKPYVYKKPSLGPKKKTAYMFYCEDNREKMKKKYPKATGVEIQRHLSNHWGLLKLDLGDEYEKYVGLGEKSKIEHKMAIEKMYGTVIDKNEGKKAIPKNIKRAEGNFINFCKDKRKELKKLHPDLEGKEISKMIADLWKQEME